MKRVYFLTSAALLRTVLTVVLVGMMPFAGFAESYTWTGAVSSEWGNSSNWSPSTGYPDYGDNAIIVSSANNPVFEEAGPFNSFTIHSGTLDLDGFTLVVSGSATFNGGSIINGNVNCSGSTVTFAGTTFASGVGVTSNTSNVYFNGGEFNHAVSITKTGSGDNPWDGGNIFKSTFSLTNSGDGEIFLANVLPDIYEQNVTFTNTGTGTIYASNTAEGNLYQGNIIFNATDGQIVFGQSGGTSILSSGKQLLVGGSGFSGVNTELKLRNLTQQGSTAQSMTFTSNATLFIEPGTTFNGTVTFSSPQLYLNGATFLSTVSLTKTGGATNQSMGGNTFGSTATIAKSSSGDMILATSNPDTFLGAVTFTNSNGVGQLRVANTAAGTYFAHNVVVNSTGSSPGISFGFNNGTCTLASGRTLTIGGSGFTSGVLRIRNLTQLGSTAQTINVTTGSAQLHLETGTVFNGTVNFAFPNLYLSGSTFMNTTTLRKRGASNNTGTGGCAFEAETVIINSGAGQLNLAGINPDVFNDDVTVSNFGNGMIQLAHGASGTQFNGNIYINSYEGSAGVKFGQSGGTSTLADGKTITIGEDGFDNGDLVLRGFTQAGTTPQSITEMVYPAALVLETNTTFNGDVLFSCPRLFLNGARFNGTASLTKHGQDADISAGGNTFEQEVLLVNSGDGEFTLGNNNPDIFNGPLVIENSGWNLINLAYASHGTQFNQNVELNNVGDAAGIRFGQNGGTSILANGKVLYIGSSGFTSGDLRLAHFTQNGSTAQTLSGFGSNVELYLEEGSVFNGTVNFTAPNLFLNGTTFNSTTNLTKTSSGFNLSNGGNVFNGVTTISNTGAGTFIMAGSQPDDFNENVTFLQQTAFRLYPAYNTNCTFAKNIITTGSNTAVVLAYNGGRVTLDGTILQRIEGDAAKPPMINNLTINKPTGNLALNVPVTIAQNLTLTSGNIGSNSINLLTLLDNATVSGVSNSSYVSGPVRKEGNDAFTFPVGKGGYYRPIRISAPSSTSHHFTAEFFLNDSHGIYSHESKDETIDHLSRCEYWILNRTNGNSNVSVTLSWNTSSCGVTEPSDLIVARWDGSQWKDHGNGGTTGGTGAGTIASSSTISNFSPFTLGSGSNENPLPVSLVHFQATPVDGKVSLQWTTATEVNNDFFSIEASTDAVHFEEVARVSGAGNSNTVLNYRAYDYAPSADVSYYRLKQVDYDGRFMYSHIEVVNMPTLWMNEVVLSPNPVIDLLDVQLDPDYFTSPAIELRDIQGKLLFRKENCVVDPQHPEKLDMSMFPQGLYFLQASESAVTVTKRVVKK